MDKVLAALATFKATLVAVTSSTSLDEAAKSALIGQAIEVYVQALADASKA